MLIRPDPLPDELDRGYHGRVMRLNGKSDPEEMLSLMATWAGVAGAPRRELSAVELLAKLAGQSLPLFVCRHTTLPLRRSITSYLPDLPHGDASNHSIIRLSAARLARHGAYFCRTCVEEDLAFHGASYWRRMLQTPGQLWCPKHGSPLCYVEHEKAFLSPPSAFLGEAHGVEPSWATALQNSATVQSFINICAGLMERDRPLDVKYVSATLRPLAAARGFRPWVRKPSAPLLSDAIVDAFEPAWLNLVFPAVLVKPRGIPLNQLDGLFYLRNAASSFVGYVLAASVLFESADEALAALLRPASYPPTVPKAARTATDSKAILASYLQNEDGFEAIASAPNGQQAPVSYKLTAMGLPTLATRHGNGAAFVENFLLKEMSIEEARTQSGISQKAMESVLRTLGNSYLALLHQMGSKTGRQARQLFPHEARLA